MFKGINSGRILGGTPALGFKFAKKKKKRPTFWKLFFIIGVYIYNTMSCFWIVQYKLNRRDFMTHAGCFLCPSSIPCVGILFCFWSLGLYEHRSIFIFIQDCVFRILLRGSSFDARLVFQLKTLHYDKVCMELKALNRDYIP